MINSLMIALLTLTTAPAQTERTITGSTPAAAVSTIEVRGNVGSILLTAASIPEVRVSVRLTAKTQWHLFGRETGDPDQVRLRMEKRGNVLEIDLFGDRKNLEEEWTIQVPENMAARVDLDVGKVRVNGIRGGCDVRTDVGQIHIDVPEGNVSARNQVGDIQVTTGTSSYGNLDGYSSVGKVRVSMDGHTVEKRRAPGAGDSFKLNGPGRDRIRAHTDVGSVELKIR